MKLSEIVLLEGGNAIENTIPLKREAFKQVQDALNKMLPRGLNPYVIGSAGQKDVSSDVDVMVDSNEMEQVFQQGSDKDNRAALEQHLLSQNLPARRTGVSVHTGIPMDGNFIQVDIMTTPNAQRISRLHQHDYSQNPNMKGGDLHRMWAALARISSTPEQEYMLSPYQGLKDRNTKELITDDKDEIAKILIGPDADASDMRSDSSLMQALKRYPNKLQALKQALAEQK